MARSSGKRDKEGAEQHLMGDRSYMSLRYRNTRFLDMLQSRLSRVYLLAFLTHYPPNSLFRSSFSTLGLASGFQSTFQPTHRLVSQLSMSSTIDIAANLKDVQERVQQATTTNSNSVRLVAVSKTKPVALLQDAYDAGCRCFGENYAQELIEKIPQLPDDVQWHFIGALQSNKANGLVQACENIERLTIETVASVKLANKLQTAVEKVDGEGKLSIFVQVNTSGEDSKSGIAPTEAVELCRHVLQECPRLNLQGLMTIGAPGDANCFAILSDCRDTVQKELGLDDALELSMGMSGDFEAAIQAGATNVRVGSTIFGARDYSNKN